jgi:hypothetical protein
VNLYSLAVALRRAGESGQPLPAHSKDFSNSSVAAHSHLPSGNQNKSVVANCVQGKLLHGAPHVTSR